MDKREQIARMAQTKEDEMLLARVYERMTNAAARSIPASTCFLSKREQMLAAELLRGQDIRFYGGRSAAICRTIWTRAGWRARTGRSPPSAHPISRAIRSRTGIFSAR